MLVIDLQPLLMQVIEKEIEQKFSYCFVLQVQICCVCKASEKYIFYQRIFIYFLVGWRHPKTLFKIRLD